MSVDREKLRELSSRATPGPWPLFSGGEYVGGVGILVAPDDGGVSPADAAFIAAARTALPDLLDALAAAEHRATRAESDRDEWKEVALQERGAALDLLEQVNVRDVRIRAWEQQYTQDTDSLTREVDEADARIRAAVAILDEDTRWQNDEHLLARVREALDGDA